MATVKTLPYVNIPVKWVIQCQVGLLKKNGSVMEFNSYASARAHAVNRAKKTGRQYGIMRTEYVARKSDTVGTPKQSRLNTKLATPKGLKPSKAPKRYNTDRSARAA